ncbi:Rab family GTPase [Pseudomonas sp. CGJS7]|uniref:Rab family GTPase n=1 Tax=Pseudomonas sp. CGJS7 TaxID=3109348 RepID=UPI00300A6202
MKSRSFKICVIGDFAVGKTSTVARSVRKTFSETYLTTVGVRVDTKALKIAGSEQRLVLWDIAGVSVLEQMRSNYILGANGLLLVADGTRKETVTIALSLREQVHRRLGRLPPSALLLNKADMIDAWDVPPATIRELERELAVFTTSAKTGQGVEESLQALATELVTQC